MTIIVRSAIFLCMMFMSARSLVRVTRLASRQVRSTVIKASSSGEPKFPSIDETAKQIKLANVLKDYQNGDETKASVFEDHVTFPSEFMIKIIGQNEPTFIIDILNSVATVINQAPEKIPFTTKETTGGKYLSISIKPVFEDAAAVYAAYDIVSKDTRVKFVI